MTQAMFAKLRFARRLVRLGNHNVGDNALPIEWVRLARDRGVTHLGRGQQHFLDLPRRHLLAASIDHVPQSSGDVDVSLFILIAKIPSPKPAVLKAARPSPASIVGNNAGSLHADFAFLT